MGLRRTLGAPDGRRTFTPKLLPNLGQMPFSQVQKATLDAKAFAVQNAPPFIHPGLNFFNPPADSNPFRWTPNPFPVYPAVGAGALVVLSYTVPRSKLAVIRKLSIVNYSGINPDGTGKVIWRVKQNGGGLRGMSTLMAQMGTFSAPQDTSIIGWENDTIVVTVELPPFLPDGVTVNPGMPLGATTAASFDGFLYPLSEATLPKGGQ